MLLRHLHSTRIEDKTMSGTNPVFLVRKAKKSSGQKDAVLWC
ncbi:hypothetical protein COP98_23525, partial [Salmonella enterica]|nr:hypothetical protein [Salmonella enterica]EDB9650562.1 hypothetical protein [Salmonella enterica subsp. enterica serovar Typhimurium]EDT1094195.1 hypothetical protein [Salmonella enterica subsp. enterica serovar 4,[5],12:i:-]EGE8687275.1 hypothetical protein [Salmonella enterica subsp. enterica]ECR1208790.1 hypothetical protein [Salmonella enterica]